MKLKDILVNCNLLEIIGDKDLDILDIAFDSRKVKPNTLFFAVKGTQVDGHDYIDKAIEQGATAIVGEKMPRKKVENVTYVKVDNSAYVLGVSASNFYGNVTGSKVSLDLSGASNFQGNIESDRIDMEISGSSKVSGSGICTEQLDMEISGSSNLDAFGLECRKVTGKLSGSSDARISCCESLTVAVSGSSDLYYKAPHGCSPVVNCSTSGGSEVHAE